MYNFFKNLMPGPLGLYAQFGDGRPDNSPGDFAALARQYAAAKGLNQGSLAPTQPMPPVQGMDLPAAASQANAPSSLDNAQWPYGPLGAPAHSAGVPMPQPRPAQANVVPMPQPRPEEAPQDPSFWQRNTAMMRDPSTGDFIDPTAAKNVDGPALIGKMMDYLYNKKASA